jgi:peptidyl-prolyl cis-trans isomerase SurA
MSLMKMKKSIFIVMCFAGLSLSKAQTKNVFTIEDISVSSDEFKRQFLKNLDLTTAIITEKDLDEYLDLYVKFKLKLKDAYDNGVDTTNAYSQEMAMYRQQLAANYLIDKEVTESLLKEAHARMQNNIKAAHILVMFPANYTEKDTLNAFLKLTAILKDIRAEKISFEDAAKKYSDDKGTSENGGNLGFFTALQLVYPFETAAYSTPIGSITNVFRTTFGYHIVKVLDIKKNEGELNVSNLLIRKGDIGKLTDEEAKKKVFDIFNSIKSGEETFEEMVRKHSEDFNTKYRAGSMGSLNLAANVGDLEKQDMVQRAFALATDGDITEPFETEKGWNIIQRGVLRELGTYETMRTMLKSIIQKDERSKKSVESLIDQVRSEEYSEISGNDMMRFFKNEVSKDSSFQKGTWKRADFPKMREEFKVIPANKSKKDKIELENVNMFSLGADNYSFGQFLDVLEIYYPKGKPIESNSEKWISNLYVSYQKDKILSYQNNHLEEKNEDFRNIYQEYREGILMFNRQQAMVWDKSNTDSAGLANYYEQHKAKYMWPDRFEMQVYNTTSKANMKKVYCQVKDGIKTDSILRYHNKKNSLEADYRAGKYAAKDGFLLSDSQILKLVFADEKYQKKNGKIYKLNEVNSDWIVVRIIEFLPAGPKKLSETRGAIAAKYQDYLEKEWISSLKAKYKVEINQEVFDSIKKELVQ